MNRHPISYLNNGIRTHKNNALFANTPVNSLIDIFLDHHHPFIIVLATLWISFPRIIRRKFPLSVRYGAHSWIPSQTKRDVRAWIYHNIAENVWMELLLNALVSFSKMCRGRFIWLSSAAKVRGVEWRTLTVPLVPHRDPMPFGGPVPQ